MKKALETKRARAKKRSAPATTPAPDKTRQSPSAYGGTTPICMNTGCTLRKKAGGCFGFEGCPGFKPR